MKDIMTITLSENKPCKKENGEYVVGQEVTIFHNEADGSYGYCYHGVNYRGDSYESKKITGFRSKQAAMRDAIDNYNIGTGC